MPWLEAVAVATSMAVPVPADSTAAFAPVGTVAVLTLPVTAAIIAVVTLAAASARV